MKPPAFWNNPPAAPGWQARLLAPLGALAARATARRVARPGGWQAPVPVICVGNVNLGGTGKTPTVIALAQRLAGRGVAVHVVSRGHGGRLGDSTSGPVQVDPMRHRATDTGDEPLLIAAFAPTWVSRDRAAGARAAVDAGAQAILLDDGLQNPTLQKDAALLVVDAATGFGNGRVVPAGPLREPVAAAAARADLMLTIGDPPAQNAFTDPGLLPRLRARLAPLQTGMDWDGMAVFAFAGIGRPAKFFATLESLGADLRGRVALDDHQPLTEPLLTRLASDAAGAGAELVTTEKDAARLPPDWRGRMLVLPVRLEPEDWTPIDALFTRLGL